MKKLFLKRKNEGYTIIETMIAISLFIIIVMAGMGALLNANLLSQKSKDMRSIIDNLSFIMEDMSRNLRTGYNYRCITSNNDLLDTNVYIPKNSSPSGSPCGGIAFEYQNGVPPETGNTHANDQWVYFIDTNGKIWKSTQGPYNNPPFNFIQLTPDEVVIDPASSFIVSGALPGTGVTGDGEQPFVTIKLVGKIIIPNKNVESPFSLQTSVSQRKLDF